MHLLLILLVQTMAEGTTGFTLDLAFSRMNKSGSFRFPLNTTCSIPLSHLGGPFVSFFPFLEHKTRHSLPAAAS